MIFLINGTSMKPLFLNILLILLITSCYNPDSSQSIEDLHKLQGKWISYDGVLFNENWRVVNNNLLEGEGFSLNGTDTAFFESLKISREGDSIYYKVFFSKEPTSVDFALKEASKSTWTFVNPENEFPQKIYYNLENDTLLTVTISDLEVNKKQLFYLKKVND